MSDLARFRISNILPDVTHAELLDSLSRQLALDDVVLNDRALRPAGDGEMQEAEFELPNDEADIIRGAMKESKVFIDRLGRTMVLRFTEIASSSHTSNAYSRSNQPCNAKVVPAVPKLQSANHFRPSDV